VVSVKSKIERAEFLTTPLESHHDRAAFSCGKPSLDNYLRDRAVPDAKGLATITFVLLDPADQRTIQGYYSLSSTSVEFDAVPSSVAKKLRISRHRAMSATLIGRLAVSTKMQGRRLGEALLFDALKRAYFAAQQVGSALIIVHALDQDAERFYERYGFIRFADVSRGLYIATATIAPSIG
jgi:GNAT superfamily N-acetyltransferase